MKLRYSYRLVVLFFLVVVFWIIIIYNIVMTYIPDNPIAIEYFSNKRSAIVKLLFPQGWNFFTRDPREHKLYFYKFKNGEIESIYNYRYVNHKNLFGLKRDLRAQGVEFGLLTHRLPDSIWRNCNMDPKKFIESNLISVNSSSFIINRSKSPYFCGTIFIVKQPPIPWAWINSKRPVVMPSKIAKLQIECIHQNIQ